MQTGGETAFQVKGTARVGAWRQNIRGHRGRVGLWVTHLAGIGRVADEAGTSGQACCEELGFVLIAQGSR